MELFIAKTAGFCFGVKRAVDTVFNEKGKVSVFGELIHNRFVISDLHEKGIKTIYDISEVQDEKVVLRSHGVPPQIYKELEKNNIEYIDCTCPYVKKIHKIVKKNYDLGKNIIIIGDKDHPEIIGVAGYADNNVLIINNENDIKNIKFDNNIYCVVVQTTFQYKTYQSILDELHLLGLKIEDHNTICHATTKRQNETNEISKKVDKMIIIGGKNSSNTKKLYDISKKNCENSIFIESIGELELNIFSTNDKIGLTAGASTPSAIIKEAISFMSELNNEFSNEDFAQLIDQSIVTLHTGDIVKGTVIRVSGGEIFVNLGYKSDGIVTKNELSDDPNIDPSTIFNTGDEIEVMILRINDGDGNVSLSKKRIEAIKGMEEIEKAFNDNAIVTGKIIDIVKGGLISVINGARVFVPSSQISSRYVEDLKSFLNQELQFKILEFDPSKRRIVAGRKELAQQQEEENKKKVFDSLEQGEKIKGIVRRIVDFGAFVDLGGVDGLIHISELSWGRVKKVTDVLSEGDTVTVTILDFDKDKGKITLSLRDVESNPWNDIEESYPIGSIVEGKVVRMVDFGAFVELEDGVDGLVHISQIAHNHVVKPEDELQIGQVIKVKVTDINKDSKKISLSKKEAEPIEELENEEETSNSSDDIAEASEKE